MFGKFLLTFCSVTFLFGCHSSGVSNSNSAPYSGVDERMLFVENSRDTVVLGTNKQAARLEETPEMKVLLNYSYWMDIHEVTCADFKTVMGNSTLASNMDCGRDDEPVVNVTFFDAVLYANQMSKDENLDTVYKYSKRSFDKDGHCISLKDFSFDLKRKGFRLPIEAEWVKSASMGGRGSFKFSDNIKEFVNDYKGALNNAVVTNFAGASASNDIDERVVKGISYDAKSSSMNLYSRGDSYPVTSSSYADYISFRLVIGVIRNATFLEQSEKKGVSNVSKNMSALNLWDYTKTSYVKLVFRNDVTGYLNYIDYTQENKIEEIVDKIPAYHPDISPDGSKVAFCTGIEGIDSESNVYVRNLDPNGSGLVKLDVENAVIPRWNVLENGDTVITYVSNAGDNSSEKSFKSRSTWQVPFANGKFGKPTKLFDGSYHGGVSYDKSLAVAGSKRLRALVNNKEAVWYNGEQACNVSLAKDFTKRTLFLDFGSKTGQAFVGKKYGVHEYIFVADSTGKLIHSIAAPNEFTFDHTEWATGRVNDNIVATLMNIDGAHTKIVLVNLVDGSISNLVSGEELWHPSLWIRGKLNAYSSSSALVSSSSNSVSSSSSLSSSVSSSSSSSSSISLSSSSSSFKSSGNSSSNSKSSSSVSTGLSSSDKIIETFELDEDSAGFYVKSNEFQEAHWSYKMELVWTYMDSANVAIFGSSRPHHGVIPSLFSDQFFAVNFASAHGSTHSSYYMAVNYVLPHYKKLKYIIIGTSFDRLYMTKLNSFFHLYAPDIKGYVYDVNHDFWKTGVPEGLLERTQEVPKVSSYKANLTERGYMPLSGCSNWSTSPRVEGSTAWYDTSLVRLEETFGYLTEIIELASQKGVKVIGAEFPQNPNYKETNAYGKYGLRNSDAPKILERIRALEKKYSNFMFFDQHKMGEHDYLEGMNYDDDHLCRAGAEQITHRLDSLLKTLD